MQGKKFLKNFKKVKLLKTSAEVILGIDLPPIPAKRYFTIGEASILCGVKPHVLRYWESEFRGLKPCKRRGNRRYYQHQDVLLVRRIRTLLYEDGFTIEGARSQLLNEPEALPSINSPITTKDATVKKIIADLENLLHNLQNLEKID